MAHVLGAAHGIEMDHRYAGGFQPAALVDGPLHADAADRFGAVGMRPDFAAQRFGQFDGEGFGSSVSCRSVERGFTPGMTGTSIPASRGSGR